MSKQSSPKKMTLQEAFQQAQAYLQAGQAAQAEQLCRQILASVPGQPDTLHLLGIIAHTNGHLDQAIQLLRQVCASPQATPLYWSNFAEMCRQKGLLQEGESAARQAVTRDSQLLGAWKNLGVILLERHKYEESLTCLEKFYASHPKDFDVLNNMAVAHQRCGDYEKAESLLRDAIAVNPTSVIGYNNLGAFLKERGKLKEAEDVYNKLALIFRDLGKMKEAEQACRMAISVNPRSENAYISLGAALKEISDLDEAEKAWRTAISINPKSDRAYSNLCALFKDQGKLDEAEEACRTAIGINPRSDSAYSNLGAVLQKQGRLDEAEDAYRMTIDINPTPDHYNNLGSFLANFGRLDEAEEIFREAADNNKISDILRVNRSLIMLLKGNLKDGLVEYEHRINLPEIKKPNTEKPIWDGSNPSGKTIFIYSEQGLGDTIQFVRYIPLLADMGAEIILAVQKELLKTVQQLVKNGIIKEAFNHVEKLPDFDFHTLLMNLPRVFSTTLENIPKNIPYIFPEPLIVETWKVRLSGTKGLRVGVVWAGSQEHKNDRNRSISLYALAPLAAIPGISLVSVQKGAGTDQVADCPFPILHLGDEIQDFTDTAAILANLNLLITVDTSVAHLGGAMGIPTWILLPFTPDWRWLLDREDSPWYPTVRLFRQKSGGDWPEVIDRVAGALKDLASQSIRPTEATC